MWDRLPRKSRVVRLDSTWHLAFPSQSVNKDSIEPGTIQDRVTRLQNAKRTDRRFVQGDPSADRRLRPSVNISRKRLQIIISFWINFDRLLYGIKVIELGLCSSTLPWKMALGIFARICVSCSKTLKNYTHMQAFGPFPNNDFCSSWSRVPGNGTTYGLSLIWRSSEHLVHH